MKAKNKEYRVSKEYLLATSSFKMVLYNANRGVCDHVQDSQLSMIFRELPPIPQPSENLKLLLLKFNSLNNPNLGSTISGENRDISKSKNRKFANGKINGFIAFRTFYCKSILNPNHQRILSKQLGKIWQKEITKDDWNLYALTYNLRDDKTLHFVEWLCNALNIKSPILPEVIKPDLPILPRETKPVRSVKRQYWIFESSIKNTVEDVYLASPQS
uniref:MAT alpha 1 protein n=1 Tax=Suhomyces bolitotheri TaxID=246028 RepID=A0A3S9NLP1_9ASCO|nr:MAT alpha 1 protein [Suhomyces bolitotheri]